MRNSTTNKDLPPESRLLVYHDPFYGDEIASHHSKVFRFVKEVLPDEEISVITSEHQKLRWSEFFKPIKYFFLAIFLLRDSIIVLHAVWKRRGSAQIVYFNPNIDPLTLILILGYRRIFHLDFSVRIRFICTVDRILTNQNYFIAKFLEVVGKLLTDSDRLSAESLRYAKYLTKLSGVGVEYLEYPPVDFLQLPKFKKGPSKKFVMLFIGNPRKDKGYLELVRIASSFRNNSNVEFRIQESVKIDREMQIVVETLRGISNVEILPSIPNSIQIAQEINSCDFLLLPYNPKVYTFRNSAFMFLGLYFGKRIATFEGSALYDSASDLNLQVNIADLAKHLGNIESYSASKFSLDTDLVTSKWRRFLK